jgi:c-di-GMP-related signal transduction protein
MIAFVARQPIFDRKLNPYAHELLFRDGLINAFPLTDGTWATSNVMSNSVLLFGIRSLTGGKKGLINITREVLLKEYVHLLPCDTVIPEMLGEIRPEPQVIDACRKLKDAGYQIALDDVSGDDRGPLFEIADFVIVDFLLTKGKRRDDLTKSLQKRKVKLLAKKIEQHEQFQRAVDLGYDYFQGFFFAKPQTLSRHEIPANKRHYLELTRQVNQPSLSFDELHDLIKRDVSLAYRLLRYLNSAYIGLPVEVHSIRHALVLLGEKEIRKWATLISLACMGEDKPSELLLAALTRARFLEMLAPILDLSEEAQDLFMLGLMSLLDAVVDRPLAECLEDMPLARPITDALLARPGLFRDILDVAIYYERAAWPDLGAASHRLHLSESRLPEIHLEAIRWARQTVGAAVGGGAASGELVP